MTWAHDDLAKDLAAHLRGASDRLVWTDMQLGPAGSPRPDVYTVPCSFARFQPVAYECKISVADFRRDVTAGKWTSYLRFAAGVIFAAPAGLLKKEDIPAGCGLIVRGPDGWRSLKGPTLKNMENLPRDAWIKLIIDGMARLADQNHEQLRAGRCNEWTLEKKLRARLGDVVADAVRDQLNAERRLKAATERLENLAAEAENERRLILDRAKQHAERDAALIDSARIELARALGLPAGAGAWEIASACKQAVRRVSIDSEVKRLRQQLERIQAAIESAAEPLPHIAREVA
ncbi:hypothetical protein K6Y76_33485 [Burkholderia cenocepacia]|uniref:hypothetical protein n=1 Tax=Burkholderia cenocepacia TaxID=95486 RepID=UPI00222ED864|nr:hypothetical protein [Burkholderia cenocepacia]MCW3522113.1 hypothetical protein [Burkholderia cenocepacia]MCW3617961.1 hypothetical protein [Burkholderia cenocepacia]MCW3655856.1 hypothetical protein [Burkholderia cenocepacia]MCW3670871.1 hypothetical protein [Burkholderia cenocepacia]MCW3685634.1 hypothetical protein [Burkholderia cenocepacia]